MLYHYKFQLETTDLKVGDLINFKGIVWNEEDQGMTFKEEIPSEILDEAESTVKVIRSS